VPAPAAADPTVECPVRPAAGSLPEAP
jgi:hypothetical protein